MTDLSKKPVADRAEHNAFFPSEYSLTQYTSKKTDFDGFKFDKPYTGGKHKVLMIGTDERYIEMQNGKLFSTGNHPVEMLLPMLHMHHAGFEIDVATLSGNPVKLEIWAMPEEDKAVMDLYNQYLPKLVNPKKLEDILPEVLAEDSPYIAVFIPGGHGVLAGVPHSKDVKKVLDWALNKDKHVITLCHGPASLLAAGVGEKAEDFPFKGYELCVFPDSLDEGANQAIGYMPGKLQWLVGENLAKLGVKIMNEGITGQVHKDRKLLTGDSPLASNNLGILAADELLKAVK
ncbi:glyoxalase III HchA [Avibacterium avium]|uniref:Molecular chaperone Hsp31 and glyoxalase 3 n=1 Tax=Avibacterium paragallinarum TaxID=728 RepID=A0A377I8P1_AVIPA|nr:glyoxalase III HchA [Avibacterium paragallinarum]POY47385.1 protein deglycase HchA [Avibacterium paragallinarum]RZN57229.1 protein deglycase HchA [Avibacterium paragallinarum]RZN77072.1 protein deglycase HchA [Avibacterium paragallinarum]TID25490.1 chaperone protein HchA [Avibacterium paragallinarum]STO71738.1 Molecular chaperone Hsp31 and glyoxalase 3 [Avibacterium paragallinarum]